MFKLERLTLSEIFKLYGADFSHYDMLSDFLDHDEASYFFYAWSWGDQLYGVGCGYEGQKGDMGLPDGYDGRCNVIVLFEIDPARRGKGHGSAFVDALKAQFMDKPIVLLSKDADSDSFWRSCGFKEVDGWMVSR